MGFIGNVLWFVFGGFVMGLGWWLSVAIGDSIQTLHLHARATWQT